MDIYIVSDPDDKSIIGIYDTETFKVKYKDYLSKRWTNLWDRYIDVEKMELNNEDFREYVQVEDIEKLVKADE